MAAEYSTKDEAFSIGQAESWKAGRFFQKQGVKSFDVHPDGTRLLIRKLAEGEQERIFDHVVFFENFVEYLKQEVPTGIK